MDEAAARQYVVEELGPIAERLGWDTSHDEVSRVLQSAHDEAGVPLAELDPPVARALLRAVAWRRAYAALILERSVSLPLGGGSIDNTVLVDRALELARLAYAEYRRLVGSAVVMQEAM